MRPPCALCAGLRCGPPAPLERPAAARQPPAMDPPNAGQVSPERWICTSGEPPPSTTPEPRADPAPLSDTLQLRRGFSPLQPFHVLVPNFLLPSQEGRTSIVCCNRPIYNFKWYQSPTSSASASVWRFPWARADLQRRRASGTDSCCAPSFPRRLWVSGRSWCPCLPLSASSGCVAAIPPEKLASAAPALGLGGACPPGFGDPRRARAHPAHRSALAGHLDLL